VTAASDVAQAAHVVELIVALGQAAAVVTHTLSAPSDAVFAPAVVFPVHVLQAVPEHMPVDAQKSCAAFKAWHVAEVYATHTLSAPSDAVFAPCLYLPTLPAVAATQSLQAVEEHLPVSAQKSCAAFAAWHVAEVYATHALSAPSDAVFAPCLYFPTPPVAATQAWQAVPEHEPPAVRSQ